MDESFNGCWTCRLRRKKCDENRPTCGACSALHITCHFGQNKPEWMDGGERQEEMTRQLKREVRENAQQRREGRAAQLSSGHVSDVAPATDIHNNGIDSSQGGVGCTLTSKDFQTFRQSDSILTMFYLEHVFPFLFPFYHPSIFQGGRAWILDMMINSVVVRQVILCQSSYFFFLSEGTADHNILWESMLVQTGDAFGVLRQALQVISNSDITEHLHGAVRITTGIMQLQRFEISILSFKNCQAHLNAALALFRQLLDDSEATELGEARSRFNALMDLLGPSSSILPIHVAQIPSSEVAAFRFSSALLIFDDIIASTMLQDQPRLYEYHISLLDIVDGADPPINLEAAVGCQNRTLLQIGEIAALDAWRQQCKRAGNLDVMKLVHRATTIKNSLEADLSRLEGDPIVIPVGCNGLLDAFLADQCQQPNNQSSLVTRIWTHAALLYLFVVVSGWQPASSDVRYHVGQIIDILTHQISPPKLLRTMVWPFCVAGCLAKPGQEAHFRGMVNALQPPSVFGTVRKALEIMENVWHNRDVEEAVSRDFATCFRNQGDLVLLV
ncbi:hypothetical protein M434DRAFT_18893 [Hypoxylon sp. CO27-5]|nr:hypothetical protein M434DRAFT_18893 [Hypoxylon sp. CO27-5]